ncbi:hypothetical protein B0H15DRAFT_955319 [Mycena belliarum]|uniref:F-box domain-containing protein n=1 Tax=Mycena belliarum TaxID=1033014 RepID=A0AAD6TRP7_9AGAR|nr:hypothetical protein B0H15DRAFT_955319 [Mycena belliae]
MAEIDAEMAWHYAQLALLKAKRNAIVPILRLPNELLSRILTIYAVESDTLFNLRWSRIMYVCRHFHALALAAQSLWAFIDLSWHAGIIRLRSQLERSGAAPVTIKMRFCDSALAVDIILEHSERICALDVVGGGPQVHELILALPQHRFPILVSISLNPNHKIEEVPGGAIAPFPQSLLDEGNLRTVKLTSIGVPWKSLRGLDTLSLTRCSDSSSHPTQTFSCLLEMLEACPQLRKLGLHYAIPPTLPEQSYPSLDLPQLASLGLSDHVGACTDLLTHLRFPPTTRMRIYTAGVNAGSDVRNLLIPLRRQVRARGAPSVGLLSVEGSGPANILFGAHHITTPPAMLYADAAFLAINVHPRSGSALRQIAAKVIKTLPFEGITHLDARIATSVTPASWRAVVDLLPALEQIYLFSNQAAVNVLLALIEIERDDRRRAGAARVRRLHIIMAVCDDKEQPMVLTVLDQLSVFLMLRAVNASDDDVPALDVLELDERYGCLNTHEGRVEALFPLVGGTMIRFGSVYDPVAAKAERERWVAIWRAEEAAEREAEEAAEREMEALAQVQADEVDEA